MGKNAWRMKPFAQTALFALVVMVVIGIAYFDFQKGQEQESAEAIKDRIFPELEGSRLDKVVFYNGRQTIEFQAIKGKWKLNKPLSDEGDDSAIDRFLMDLLKQDVHPVEVKGKINWSEYGLEKPQGYFNLKTIDGREYQVEISGGPSFNGSYYLRKENQLFIGYRQWGELIKMEFDAFRDKRLLMEGAKVHSIQFVNEREVFRLDLRQGQWRESKGVGIESHQVKAFVKNQIVDAQITRFVKEDKEKLSKYKLEKPFGKLVMEWSRGTQDDRTLGTQDDNTLVVEWTFTDPSQAPVFMQSSLKQGIYQVSSTLAQQWVKISNDFRASQGQNKPLDPSEKSQKDKKESSDLNGDSKGRQRKEETHVH